MPRDLPEDITHPDIPPSLSHHSIPLSEWKGQVANQGCKALAAGAFIFRTTQAKDEGQIQSQKPLLLLLLRAATDSFPNVWEPPGGSVDEEDATILHGLVREVFEETGLRVSSVLEQVWDGTGSRSSDASASERREVTFFGKHGEKWCKLNFVVDCLAELKHVEGVESPGESGRVRKGGELNIQLDEDEHQDWGWFDKEEMEGVPFISEQGREIARNAFAAFEDVLRGRTSS